ncbi:MAG: hypothetical protein IJN88_00130 [Clostridia bacterium]|nr:hypothetical protein [Clostridia bacterium]
MKYKVAPSDYDYNTNKQIIEDLIKEYPFLNVQLIGRTSLGRGIFSLSLGTCKNNAVYTGSVRGSDGLSCLILYLFMERLCYAVKNNSTLASVNIRKALTHSGITVIPCLNPDGREIFRHGAGTAGSLSSFVSSLCGTDKTQWSSNAMGVDISRNFIFSDSSAEPVCSPAPSLFRGDYPESEAETRALTRLCRLRCFRQCIEIFSGEDEIFYRSEQEEPISSQMMAKILSFSCGCPVSTDKSFRQAGIMDWFIREFRRPAFSLGVSGNAGELYSVYSRLEEALTVFALL